VARQAEGLLVARCQRYIKKRWAGAVVRKLADKNTKSLPDLQVLHQYKSVLLVLDIECKTPKGPIRPLQIYALSDCNARLMGTAAGGYYRARVVRSLDDLAMVMDEAEYHALSQHHRVCLKQASH
jgi:hypothetical protein